VPPITKNTSSGSSASFRKTRVHPGQPASLPEEASTDFERKFVAAGREVYATDGKSLAAARATMRMRNFAELKKTFASARRDVGLVNSFRYFCSSFEQCRLAGFIGISVPNSWQKEMYAAVLVDLPHIRDDRRENAL